MAIQCLTQTANTIGIAGFVILHPVIGIVAQPFLLVKTIVHAIAMNYHFSKTVRSNGIALSNDLYQSDMINYLPTYMKKDFECENKDLPQLQHEKAMLLHLQKLDKTVATMRRLQNALFRL